MCLLLASRAWLWLQNYMPLQDAQLSALAKHLAAGVLVSLNTLPT